MTLKELPYQDGINWKELEGKPAIFNWNGKPMAGTPLLGRFQQSRRSRTVRLHAGLIYLAG